MTRLNAKNNAETVLAQAVSESDTEFVVEDAGALPDVPFRLSVEDEIVEVSAVDGNTLTVERAVEDTQAGNYGAGTAVKSRLTAGMYGKLISEEEFASHKAETATNAHLAKNIGLEDVEGNFTATEIEGAMTELFTNVSNGKQLVGTAITDVDDKVIVPNEPTFQELANVIGEIRTFGKKARGSAKATPEYVVTGINFKPQFVVLVDEGNRIGIALDINGGYQTASGAHVSVSSAPTMDTDGTWMFTVRRGAIQGYPDFTWEAYETIY